jgi:hypothetical protein
MNDITIAVTLNGKTVYRNYRTEDLLEDKSALYGTEVSDMILTLRGAEDVKQFDV